MSPCGRPVTDCADVLRRSDVVLSGLHRTGLVWSGVVLSGLRAGLVCSGLVWSGVVLSVCLVWSGVRCPAPVRSAPVSGAVRSDVLRRCRPVCSGQIWSGVLSALDCIGLHCSGLVWSVSVRTALVWSGVLLRCPVSCSGLVWSDVAEQSCPVSCSGLVWSGVLSCCLRAGLHCIGLVWSALDLRRTARRCRLVLSVLSGLVRCRPVWSALVCIGLVCSGVLSSCLVRCRPALRHTDLRRSARRTGLLWSVLVRCPVRCPMSQRSPVWTAPDCAPVSDVVLCCCSRYARRCRPVWTALHRTGLHCIGLHCIGLHWSGVVLSGLHKNDDCAGLVCAVQTSPAQCAPMSSCAVSQRLRQSGLLWTGLHWTGSHRE